MTRRTPLTPIFDEEPRRGAINVGNSPGTTPVVTYACPVIDTLTFTGGQINAIAISGDYAFATDEGANNKVYAIDISDPENLTVVDTLSHAIDGTLNDPTGIAISGSYAFVNASAGLTAIDISNPAAMSIVDHIVVGTGSEYVAISGTHAFVTNPGNDTLISVDISNPAAMTVSQYFQDNTNLNNCWGLAISGSHAYVACLTFDGLTAVDISNPASMSVADSISVADTVDAAFVAVSGSFAYVVTSSGANDFVTAIDISTPTALAYNDSWTETVFQTLRQPVIVGTTIYFGSFANDRIYAAPLGAGSPGSPGYDATNYVTDATNLNQPHALANSGDFLFVGTGDGRFSSVWTGCFS